MHGLGRETTLLAKNIRLEERSPSGTCNGQPFEFAYFCIYNPDFQESRGSQVPQLPFGATNSVFEAGSDAPLHSHGV